jgi:hypothetical protein
MVGTGKTFALDAVGAWAIESLVYFFVGALAIAFLGAGRYAIAGNSAWRYVRQGFPLTLAAFCLPGCCCSFLKPFF